jgi:hypothetical protein
LFTFGAGCAVIIPVAVSVTINCIASTLVVLLQLLKQMVQSQLGVIQIGVAKKVHPRAMVILRFPQRFPLITPNRD